MNFSDTPTLRRVLAVVTGAVLVAGIAAVAIGVEDDAEQDVAARDRGAEQQTGAPASDLPLPLPGADGSETAAPAGGGAAGGPGAPAPDGGTATTARGGSTGGSSGGTSTATTLPADFNPGTYTAPKAGKYRQRYTSGGRTEEREVVVEVATAGGDTSIKKTAQESGATVTFEYLLKGDRLLLDAINAMGFRCDFQPDVVWFTLPLKPGATWSSESSCSVTVPGPNGPEQVTSTLKHESKVVGGERLTIGDTQVDTLIVEREADVTNRSSRGDQTQHQSTREWVAPRYGLTVKSTQKGGSNDQAQELTSLTPS